jgi:hypothetical protein
MADARVKVVSPVREGFYHHVFVRSNGDGVLILWNREHDASALVTVPAPWHRIEEVRLDGSTESIPLTNPIDVDLVRGMPRICRFSR